VRAPGPISLGDLVAALRVLQPSTDGEAGIARLLGFRTAPAERPVTSAQPQSATAPPLTSARQSTETVAETQARFLPGSDKFEVLLSESEALGSARLVSGIKPLERGDPEDTLPSPPVAPLFRPRWTRHLISGALSTSGDSGSIDFERLCEAMARMQPVVRLPCHPLPTLKRGVQVLVDQGEGMQPFIEDQEQMLRCIVRVVGKDKATVMGFAGSPLRGAGESSRWEWREYRPPGQGTPVLLMTDLGIRQSTRWSEWADEAEWLAFARTLNRSGNPLAALVPYGRDRWPASLRTAVKIIHWDQRTTISKVRATIGTTLGAGG
jgi:hypothetical protein